MSHPKDGAVDDTKEGEDVDDNGLAAGLASADSFRKFLTSYRRVRKLPEASDDGAVAAHLERAQNSYSFADENGPSRRPTAAATAAEAATRYSNMRRSPRHRRALDYYLRDTTGNRGGQRAKQPHGRSIPTGSGGGDRNALGDLRNRAAARSASVGPFMPWTDPSESFSSALARLDKLHVPETLAHVLIELDRMGHWGVYTIQRVLFDCWQLAFAIVGAGARSPRSRASMFGAYLATLEARTPYLIPESAAEIGDAAPERDLAPNHVEFLDQLADAYRFGALNAAADGDRALARRHIRLAMPIRRRLYGDLSDAVLMCLLYWYRLGAPTPHLLRVAAPKKPKKSTRRQHQQQHQQQPVSRDTRDLVLRARDAAIVTDWILRCRSVQRDPQDYLVVLHDQVIDAAAQLALCPASTVARLLHRHAWRTLWRGLVATEKQRCVYKGVTVPAPSINPLAPLNPLAYGDWVELLVRNSAFAPRVRGRVSICSCPSPSVCALCSRGISRPWAGNCARRLLENAWRRTETAAAVDAPARATGSNGPSRKGPADGGGGVHSAMSQIADFRTGSIQVAIGCLHAQAGSWRDALGPLRSAVRCLLRVQPSTRLVLARCAEAAVHLLDVLQYTGGRRGRRLAIAAVLRQTMPLLAVSAHQDAQGNDVDPRRAASLAGRGERGGYGYGYGYGQGDDQGDGKSGDSDPIDLVGADSNIWRRCDTKWSVWHQRLMQRHAVAGSLSAVGEALRSWPTPEAYRHMVRIAAHRFGHDADPHRADIHDCTRPCGGDDDDDDAR